MGNKSFKKNAHETHFCEVCIQYAEHCVSIYIQSKFIIFYRNMIPSAMQKFQLSFPKTGGDGVSVTVGQKYYKIPIKRIFCSPK